MPTENKFVACLIHEYFTFNDIYTVVIKALSRYMFFSFQFARPVLYDI